MALNVEMMTDQRQTILASNSDNTPSVLIVMPTYNRVDYLHRVMACFLAQDYKNVDIVIIKDEDMVTLWIDDIPNAHVINIGGKIPLGVKLDMASKFNNSDYIMYWSDDDIYLEENVSHFVRAMEDNEDKNVISDNKTYTHIEFDLKDTEMNSKNFIVSRSTYEACGGFKSMSNEVIFDEFLMSIPNDEKLLIDNDDPYFIYSWTGVNYHTSTNSVCDPKYKDRHKKIRRVFSKYKVPTSIEIVPNFQSMNCVLAAIENKTKDQPYRLLDQDGKYYMLGL